MIQAYVDGAVIVGVTRGNIERLTAHQPMRIVLRRPMTEIFVVFGETKPDIIREIEAAGGPRFEDAHKAAAEEDPS